MQSTEKLILYGGTGKRRRHVRGGLEDQKKLAKAPLNDLLKKLFLQVPGDFIICRDLEDGDKAGYVTLIFVSDVKKRV